MHSLLYTFTIAIVKHQSMMITGENFSMCSVNQSVVAFNIMHSLTVAISKIYRKPTRSIETGELINFKLNL